MGPEIDRGPDLEQAVGDAVPADDPSTAPFAVEEPLPPDTDSDTPPASTSVAPVDQED